MNHFELNFVSLGSNYEIAMRGSEDFCRSISNALRLLSTRESYMQLFLSSVKDICEVQELKYAAQMHLAPGRGRIDVNRLRFRSMDSMDLVLMLAHEAYHNHLYQDYLKHWTAWYAKRRYDVDLPIIEKKCIDYEISLAQEFDFPEDRLRTLKFLSLLLNHPKMLPDQYNALRFLRSRLAISST